MKNKTQGETIKARRNTLKRMKLQCIVPLHQILDNEIYEAYKEEIFATKMSYLLVPPDDQLRDISEREIHAWKIISLAFLPEQLKLSSYTDGARYFPRPRDSSSC